MIKCPVLRRVFAALLALSMTAALFACGKDDVAAEKEKKLVVWVYSGEYKAQLERAVTESLTAIDWELKAEVIEPSEMDERLAEAEKNGNGLPDIVMLSPDNLRRYVENGFAADLSECGITLSGTKYYNYTIQAGTDDDGVLRAACWEPDPGLFFYRRSMAKRYLGTDDPDEIQTMMSTWEGFLETARTVESASLGSTVMTVGLEGIQQAYMSGTGWTEGGRFTISTRAADYMEFAHTLYDEGLVYDAEQWSAAWTAGISDPRSVFGYFCSGFGMESILKPASGGEVGGEGSFGDWAAVPGPQPYNWGGCWFAVREDTERMNEAAVFLQYFICEEEAMKKDCLIDGRFSANRTVVDEIKFDAQFSEPFLGGQNYYQLLAKAADKASMDGLSQWSQVIDEAFTGCVRSYACDKKDAEEALGDFVRTVQAAYPELF